METKYDINEKIYIPATVTKVTKTSDGKVYYRLESDIGNWDLNVTENQVDQLCLVIPNELWVISDEKTVILGRDSLSNDEKQETRTTFEKRC